MSGYALAASLMPVRFALAATELKALRLIDSLGKPSAVWMAFEILRPALQQELKIDVTTQTIPGNDGFDAIKAVLEPQTDETRLFGCSLMGMQFAATIVKTDIRFDDMLPIAKLTKSISVTLIAKQGSPLKTWADLTAAKTLLKISTVQRGTATYVAALMMERKGGLFSTEVELRDTIGEVVEDVAAGRSELGVIPTFLIPRRLDRLQTIVTFGAERNATLSNTPTFAEATGNPKLAFTESVGLFAAPKLAPSIAAELSKAFVATGNDLDVDDRAEAVNFPLAVSGPDALIATMKRNERVLRADSGLETANSRHGRGS